PFFIEGAAIYSFGIGIGDGDMGSESLFYSRRIGRPPQGSAEQGDGWADTPEMTTILGAWKLSGKTRSGWSIGLLHAMTAEESARVAAPDGTRVETPVEPFSNYGVARIQKDFREGRSAVGLIGTAAIRERDVADELALRSRAYAGGFDFRHRFGADDRFLASGYLLGSEVSGSVEAMTLTQRSPARYFQRPDATHVEFDPGLTSLAGWAGKAELFKVGGGFWRWGTTVNAKSPGFEPNDLGFQRESDLILHAGFIGYNHYTPSDRLREWNLNLNAWHGWSFGGERLATGGNLNGSFTLPSYWGGFAGVNRDGEAFSNSTLRGGPLIRREARTNGWFGFFSDSRKAVQVNWQNNWARASESGSWSVNSSANARWRPSGRMSLRVGPFINRTVNALQWVDRIRTSEDHYVFGRIDQRTVGVTGRFDFTFKPDLTLQFYVQPFLSAGAYRDFKQVENPRAERYQDRYSPLDPTLVEDRYEVDLDGDGTLESFGNPDFNFQQFRSNVVLRWEYRPGSLLYLVWSQGRDHLTPVGNLALGDDLGDLFGQNPENVFLLKLSYWLTP
ncbi:MAG: DUF5916 domain-containing protein, partial [Longimicrobiales bacterium]